MKKIFLLMFLALFCCPVSWAVTPGDISGDNKVGLAEAVHALKVTAGLPTPNVVVPPSTSKALVGKTGQTTSYAAGDDGDLQKGVENSSPRFTDNNDGTVTDNQTGLIWLKNANAAGEKNWNDALTYCNSLATGAAGLTDGSQAGDWRLPNKFEIESIFNGTYNVALHTNHPFVNIDTFVSHGHCFSSTTYSLHPDFAFAVYMYNCTTDVKYKSSSSFVWPVRNELPSPPATTITNPLGMTFNRIEPGTFMMGSPTDEADRKSDETQHEVTLTQAYYMQTTEVTQGQWEAVMGTSPWRIDVSNQVIRDPYMPAVYISWDGVQSFISAMNALGEGTYRLPTESEWEYAARGGSITAYHFGNDAGLLGDYAWCRTNTLMVDENYAHHVGLKIENQYGLYDMHGNVDEWCEDWYGIYPEGSVTDPVGLSFGTYRVVRGGGIGHYVSWLRSASRNYYEPNATYSSIGFRLVRTP